MATNALECPVCMLTYDSSSKRPSVFPCGHIFCMSCIDGFKHQNQNVVVCPTCRTGHTVPESGHFPVCYAYETLLKRSSKPQEGAAVTCEGKGGKVVGKAVQAILQDQEEKLVGALRACQEVQTQIDQYKTTLAGWREEHHQLKDRLQGLVDQVRDSTLLVQEEESRVLKKQLEMDERNEQLQAALQATRQAETREQAFDAIEEVHSLDPEEETQGREEYLAMFPDVNTVTTINKVIDVSNAALTAADKQAAQYTQCGAAENSSLPLPAPPSSITDRVNALMHEKELRVLTPTKKKASSQLAEDILCCLTLPTKILVQRGLVYAVDLRYRKSHAKISQTGNSTYLHCMQEADQVPHGAVTIQVNELLSNVLPWRVFLDIAWPYYGESVEHYQRRVEINLNHDTPAGRQFLMLCMGQRNCSYKKTSLIEVSGKGTNQECVWGGDYNGTGGAALLHNLEDGDYTAGEWKAGDVWGYVDVPSLGAQFGINIDDLSGNTYGKPCVFGHVVKGLHAVKLVARHVPITEATVVDCGVVLCKDSEKDIEIFNSTYEEFDETWD